MARGGPDLLRGPLQHLEVVRGGPGADGKCDLVVEQVDHQVKADSLLPVNIRVTNWQFSAISSANDENDP